MFAQNTTWLTLTNILLGSLVVIFLLLIAGGALCESLSERSKRRHFEAELDHDLEILFAAPRPPVPAAHAGTFHRLLEGCCRLWHRKRRAGPA